MSDFTHANLLEVEDSAVKFGFSPALESRFARGALEYRAGRPLLPASRSRRALAVRPSPRLAGGDLRDPGGGGRAKLDEEIVELRPLDALRVAPEVTRAFEAGPEGLELLAFGGGEGGTQDAEVEPGWWAAAD